MRALTLSFAAGAIALGLSLGLAGCTPKPLIRPLGPAALGASIEARQQVTVHYHGNTRAMQVALRVVPDDLTLIGLSAIGQRLFTLGWDGQSIRRGRGLGEAEDLPARRILADLELAYWPLPALQKALVDSDLRLERLGDTRSLWRGDQLLWIAYRAPGDPWHSRLTVYNARLGYRLDVQPLAFKIPSNRQTP
ncbi:DUF3261 domain-containing protein [Salinisphaera sp.]|uniref:DUF3261 domain-containing protein n=1 Tax=Salinisphaera sp. TaxID=1914330 RepID=UPI002D79A449|nr:DUF3261 domain-containing protein [Salinisphaera sp.]HET7313275.1 DUF3261 domain-containing protein [Salinisphaera sp.]